jgi:hypothetical protein
VVDDAVLLPAAPSEKPPADTIAEVRPQSQAGNGRQGLLSLCGFCLFLGLPNLFYS